MEIKFLSGGLGSGRVIEVVERPREQHTFVCECGGTVVLGHPLFDSGRCPNPRHEDVLTRQEMLRLSKTPLPAGAPPIFF